MRADRGKQGHESWTSVLIATAFLGCADPWNKPQFQAMLEGFIALLTHENEVTITEVVLIFIPTHQLTLLEKAFAVYQNISVGNNPVFIQLADCVCLRRQTALCLRDNRRRRLPFPQTRGCYPLWVPGDSFRISQWLRACSGNSTKLRD